jgi:hypothetical protein
MTGAAGTENHPPLKGDFSLISLHINLFFADTAGDLP